MQRLAFNFSKRNTEKMRIILREANVEYSIEDAPKIVTPDDVWKACQEIANSDTEVFSVLLLDVKGKLILSEIITSGILDQSIIHPRETFRLAIKRNAASIILVHNHPSGDVTPSLDDLTITRQMIEAGKILDIHVLDHVIISYNTSCFSIREKGLLSFV